MVDSQIIRIAPSPPSCCQGRPSTKASNWAWESVSEPFPGPTEAPLVESPAGEPDPLAVVDQHLHPGAAPVGEEVGVMRARLAEDLHHLGKERVHAGPHVERRHRQPQRLDPDHPSHSRSQAPQAAAEDAGHSTVTDAAPLRNSIRIGASGQEESCTGTKPPIGSGAATRKGRQDNSGGSMPRSRIQRRS